MSSGNYPDLCKKLTRSKTINSIGERVEGFTISDSLWCRVTEDSSRLATEFGGSQSGIDGTIYIRNYPSITTLDMLRDNLNRVWKIESLKRGDNELILDVYTDDALQDFLII